MREDRDACLASGMDDYVAKPVRKAVLFAAIERVLAGRPAGETAWADESLARGDGAEASDEMLPVFDAAALEDLRSLEAAGLSIAEMVEIFAEEGRAQLEGMRRALQGGHSSDFRREAHTLKGSARDLGARRLAALCDELEDLGKEENLTPPPPLWGICTSSTIRSGLRLCASRRPSSPFLASWTSQCNAQRIAPIFLRERRESSTRRTRLLGALRHLLLAGPCPEKDSTSAPHSLQNLISSSVW